MSSRSAVRSKAAATSPAPDRHETSTIWATPSEVDFCGGRPADAIEAPHLDLGAGACPAPEGVPRRRPTTGSVKESASQPLYVIYVTTVTKLCQSLRTLAPSVGSDGADEKGVALAATAAQSSGTQPTATTAQFV